MLIVAGKIYVDPVVRSQYLDDCVAVVEAARSFDGCLDFALTADTVEPGRINVYERWKSDEQLERFRGSGPEGPQAEQIRDAEVHKYRISAVEEP